MKITDAMLAIGSLEADARNDYDGYDYISADKILERVGRVLGDNGLAIVPAVTDADVENVGEKKAIWLASVNMEMHLLQDDEVLLSVPWFGSGVDYRVPDKAIYKAMTSGHKYFLTKLLMIGVGNEDGEHEYATGVATGSKKQRPAKNPNILEPESSAKSRQDKKKPVEDTDETIYNSLDGQVVQGMVAEGLSETTQSAATVLARFEPKQGTLEEFMNKMKLYRQWKDHFVADNMDAKEATAKAIQKANEGESL